MKVAGRELRACEWADDAIRCIDQRVLPARLEFATLATLEQAAIAIEDMTVRGAPLIGVVAAYALALAARRGEPLDAAYARLARTRPTAINLWTGLGRVRAAAPDPAAMLAAARAFDEAEVAAAEAIGEHGLALVTHRARVLTHCNAGGLATAGYGTAVGVIRAAAEAGKRIMVWVDETRPLLQGARLTAWELVRAGISATLITDNMAGYFMGRGQVDLVVVGADRIARNGDVANKIGTYSVALLARTHGIPFYVAAPISTLDLSLADGSQIPIEERAAEEVTQIGGRRVAPAGVRVANPPVDVTPASCVDAIITERGIACPPYDVSLPRLAGEA